MIGTGSDDVDCMILRITPHSISKGNSTVKPGPSEASEDCYYVKIHNIPEGVSAVQVILLFTHTAKKNADKGHVYEFEFSDLCPSAEFNRY